MDWSDSYDQLGLKVVKLPSFYENFGKQLSTNVDAVKLLINQGLKPFDRNWTDSPNNWDRV